MWKLQLHRGGTVLLRLWSASRGSIRAAAEARQCLCEWKSQRRGTGVCQSDGVRSLTTKTDPHSSDKIEMSHISTHKATLQDNSNAVTGSVSGNLYKEKKYCIHKWKSLWHTHWIGFNPNLLGLVLKKKGGVKASLCCRHDVSLCEMGECEPWFDRTAGPLALLWLYGGFHIGLILSRLSLKL